MTIHVVRAGETLTSIGAQYGVSAERIAADNEIPIDTPLVVGQTVVILFPVRTYTVQEGDTLTSISAQFNIPIIVLLRNNPIISSTGTTYTGQTIVLEYPRPPLGPTTTNGYVYPNVDPITMRKTLPYLTYLTIFTYGFTPEGILIAPDDTDAVDYARSYGVAPIMHFSTLGPDGTFSSELGHALLNDPQMQRRVLEQILQAMREKGYSGLDIDFEFLPPEDRQAYVDFIESVTATLNAMGYFVMVALAPKTSADQPGTLYESHDYAGLGAAANYVLIMAYEWGYTYGPPMAVAPINKVREVLNYAVTEIPREKIILGMPNYGYDFTLPFVRGESRAQSLGNVAAVNLARQWGAEILYDETAQAPYFFYTDLEGRIHEVWFEDARSMDAKFRLIYEYGLSGQAFWNLMRFFPQSWLVANALYSIERVYT